MTKRINLEGQEYGRLTVLRLAQIDLHGRTHWLCLCQCGQLIVVLAAQLRRGNTRSCGCLQREQSRKRFTTHGDRESAEYRTWIGMIERSANQKRQAWKNYGDRGIIVCERWRHNYAAFLVDMGRKPSPELTLERKDNDGPYSPSNCRWATRQEQNRNTRLNRIVTVDGQTAPISELCERFGLNKRRIWRLIHRRKMTPKEAFVYARQ
jgi:hypothetical protein